MYTTSVRPQLDYGPLSDSQRSLVRTGEYVFSWRTGKKAGDLVDFIDLRYPKVSTNLGSTLRSRKSFYEQLDQNMISSSQGRPETYKCLTGDTGHDFTSIKFTGHPDRVISRSISGTQADRFVTGFPYLPVVPSWILKPNNSQFLTTDEWAPSNKLGGLPTAAINRLFNNTVPDNLGLGEFIVELTRGNLPGLLTSLRSAARKTNKLAAKSRVYKTQDPSFFRQVIDVFDIGKKRPTWISSVGADYIEFQFGMMPFIRLFLDVLFKLEQLVGGLYGESFRRQRRSFPDRNVFNETIAYSGRPTNASFYSGPLPSLATSTGGGYLHAHSMSYAYSQDHSLTLRATRAGNPSSGLRSTMDSTSDVIKATGVWYPSLGWDLLPWSWLIDYFVQIGSAIENVSAYSKSGVTPLDYAYVTTKFKSYVQRTTPMKVVSEKYWTHELQNTTSFASTTVTHRQRCTPFGFTVSGLDSLSTSQYAILVALGLAKR